MVYCVTCKCYVDTCDSEAPEAHKGYILAHTAGEKASEEVIARLSE